MAGGRLCSVTAHAVTTKFSKEVSGMKKSIFKILGTAALSALLFSSAAYAGQWEWNGSVWKYKNDNGQYSSDCWQWIDGDNNGIAECYRFDGNGILYVSTVVDGYMVDGNGAWIENRVVQVKNTAQVNGGNAADNGGQNSNNSTSESGQNNQQNVQEGWYLQNNLWRYRYHGADLADTWRNISGKKYYFQEDGYMATDFQSIDGDTYYFNSDGSLQTKTFLKNGVHYVISGKDGVITDEIDDSDWSDYKKANQGSGSSGSSGSGSNGSGSSGSGSGNSGANGSGSGSPGSSGGNTGSGSSDGGSSSGGSANAGDDSSDYAYQVYELVNQERAAAGKEALEWNSEVAEKAQIRAEELVDKFSHDRPDGSSCFTVLDGIDNMGCGENIAMGQRNPSSVMNSWMNSSGHKANILRDNFTDIGVGCYESGGTLHWVQLFIKD